MKRIVIKYPLRCLCSSTSTKHCSELLLLLFLGHLTSLFLLQLKLEFVSEDTNDSTQMHQNFRSGWTLLLHASYILTLVEVPLRISPLVLHSSMTSSGMIWCVTLVITDVSEQRIASIIRVKILSELRTTLAVTGNWSTQPSRETAQRAPVTSYC
jgi:hypothetical protein